MGVAERVGDADALRVVRSALKSQYHATLSMLRGAIERCPDDPWASSDRVNPSWRIAYHALYFTHLYLQAGEHSFRPWGLHQTWIEYMDDVPGSPDLDEYLELPERPLQTGTPYTRAELLDYWRLVDAMVDDCVDALDLLDPYSGFSWHQPRRSKMEQQIVNIRHLQLHATQLSDRLPPGSGVEWVGSSASRV